jgi:hypothetical protein
MIENRPSKPPTNRVGAVAVASRGIAHILQPIINSFAPLHAIFPLSRGVAKSLPDVVKRCAEASERLLACLGNRHAARYEVLGLCVDEPVELGVGVGRRVG